MSNPPPQARVATNRLEQSGKIGLWSMAGGDPVVLAGSARGSTQGVARGSAVVLVPSEHVLLLATPLPPLPGTARRRSALPFAIEDRIADPLDQVHVALGREMAPGVWLSAVVGHDVMHAWVAQLGQAGLERAVLMPDVLTLPVPQVAQWSVAFADARVLVRCDDGSGFALPLAQFATAWNLAGLPICVHYGAPPPPQLAGLPFEAGQPVADVNTPDLDLRQGLYAAPRASINPLWQRIALVAGIGALAQGAIAVADTIALAHLAQQRDAQVRTLAHSLQPGLAMDGSMSDALAAMTPDGAGAQPGAFIGLLSRSAAALTASKVTASWRSVAYDKSAGTLTIEMEVGEIGDLQAIAQSLTRAGFGVQQGAASSANGHAIGSFVIRAA